MKGTIFAVLFLLCLLVPSCKAKNAPSTTKNPNSCLQGSPSLPGRNGVNGHNGLPGRDGRDGAKGEKGVAGVPGPRGIMGEKGMTGTLGPRGVKGETGPSGTDTDHRNWKQCTWRSVDGRDIGLIKDCQFTKTKDDSALRVVYQGNFYLYGNNCCKRWFITFNGAECSGPLPIDAVLWVNKGAGYQQHRPGSIEGCCGNIHKGKVRVGINIGNCAGYGNSDGSTGWNSVSRLIIEEVPRSQ